MHPGANRDFTEMLSVMGVSLAYVDAISHDSADMIEFPSGDWNYVTGPSEIQGVGGFTTKAAQSGDLLAPARRLRCRTPAGRYTNHAPTPNARMREDGDDLD